MKRVISILAVVCLLFAGLAGAQDYVCGDANYDSVANIDDGAYLFDYLVTGGPAPELPDPAWANWDGHDGLTINDVFACKMDMDSGLYNPSCPVEGPDSLWTNGIVFYEDGIPAQVDHAIISLSANRSMRAFIFPIQVLIDGIPTAIDSISVLSALSPDIVLFKGSIIYPDSSFCVIGACCKANYTVIDDFATIYISFTPDVSERTVSLERADLYPGQSLDSAENISPILVYRYYPNDVYVTQASYRSYCCEVPGDANNDGVCNIGDAIFMITYAFRGGAAPVCPLAGDANGDCALNIGDATYILSYCFRGGCAPTCGCAK